MWIVSLMALFVVLAAGQSDFEALLELKKGLEKDPSGQVFSSWVSKSIASDGCPKNWFGVACVDGHVTSITLNDLGLIGNFSFPVIASLEMLGNLSLSNNRLTGTVSNIGSLQSLQFLDLSCNAFHGLLPSNIVNLQNLVLLNLSVNNFEGKLPFGFNKLEKLEYLDLRANGFSGDIMNLLTQLDAVVHVDLSNNQFSGTVDPSLGRSSFVSLIKYLNVSHNLLVGELFAHDGTPFFDSLEVFDASNNQLMGTIPSFNFIFSLRILRLGSNQLTGSLPEALLQESSMVLTELDLSLNQLQGPVGSITSTTLRKLNISSNKLSGPLPLKVGHCAIIDLSNNMLSGELTRIVGWGNYVEVLQLSSNLLAGTLPNQTSQFLRLTTLKISNNHLEGNLPEILGTYPELKVIDLSLNHLSGFLPPSLFSSTTLTDLRLSGNNLNGSIPLSGAERLFSVDSSQNPSLVTLDLSSNSLSGTLPKEISKFHNLAFLNLSNNKLEGSIPDNLPASLKEFNVSLNNFSGAVPDNLKQFPDSAFHPGNLFLFFSTSPSSPEGSSRSVLSRHNRHMEPAIKIALITGLVGGFAVIVVACVMVCYKSNWPRHGINDSKGKVSKECVQHRSAPNKSLDSPASSFSFQQNPAPSPKEDSTHEQVDTSLVVNEHKDFFVDPESKIKDDTLPSPISIFPSSNTYPSRNLKPSSLVIRSPEKLGGDLHLFDSSMVFTAEELSLAPAEVIGRSCHGALYRATLPSGLILAIKWLKEGIVKGKKDFSREMKKLGSIKHPNLVSLRGYYWGPKEHEKLIVSNYVNAPCLALYLQEAQMEKVPPLSLGKRLRVAADVARCLNYLHNERAIPHGNLKSTNILLESPNMTALVTDYSFHRILTPSGTAEQVLNAGALGYRPPEFASTSKPCPSLKSDVYAFGVILLELLTGKSSGDIIPWNSGVVDLTDWVRLLAAENRSIQCFDWLILDRQKPEQPQRVLDALLQVALTCILPASERPDMKSVFEDISLVASIEGTR